MRALSVQIATPAEAGSRAGNRVTAERWAGLLGELGHDVRIAVGWDRDPADLLIALHAGRSHASVRAFRTAQPRAGVVVALTGTDVYGALATDPLMLESMHLADRLVVLQPLAAERVPDRYRDRVVTIHQSCSAPRGVARAPGFQVCVLAHLRAVKDPFLVAEAAYLLPADSPVRIVHAGGARDAKDAARALQLADRVERYQWRGDIARKGALHLLAESQLLVLTSRAEGGANVVTEAIACRTPVISTRIDGSLGLLGQDYPGYVPVGDAEALAAAMHRAATDRAFYADLGARISALGPLVDPATERDAWHGLLLGLETG
ncbi:MAG TPA: selenoneine biosynthesis selenosugar synthase SenB [Kofleriaceae bacterium]|nr:selenoneine biosynthesis selenosugar synthase SenB [Kofleriaceae bacterium]